MLLKLNYRIILFAFVFNCSFFTQIKAQFYFTHADTIPVNWLGNLSNAWGGGLNNPQFSNADFNNDGLLDVFIFDKSDNHVTTYVNDGSQLVYSNQYQTSFPKLNGWALLHDYDGDGINDLFTSSYDTAVAVYKGSYIFNTLNFTLVDTALRYDDAGNSKSIIVSQFDVPALSDVDSDGDLDIITFEKTGGFIYYYENVSTVNGLDFVLANQCWGNVYEDMISQALTLGISCKGGGAHTNNAHPGSTLLLLDGDNDGDKDLILGDLNYNTLNYLENTGSSTSADLSSNDIMFPSYDVTASTNSFPAAYFVEINNDGKKDLIVSPNQANLSFNKNCAWYYQNSGTTNAPVFNKVKENLFVEDMLDFGEGAIPVLRDINLDGLLDLVVGNFGYYKAGPDVQGQLALFENVGTASQPSFSLLADDWLNLSTLSTLSGNPFQGVHPTFGDLDGDGDDDLIIGELEGELYYFQNQAGGGLPPNLVFTSLVGSIDVGQSSAPQLVDVNKDGLLDLIVGERDGNINYYENTGTATTYNFTLVSNTWGNVDTRFTNPQGLFTNPGYSTPYLTVLDTSNEYQLLVGSQDGSVFHYNNIDGNLMGSFTKVTDNFFDVDLGGRTTLTITDVNGDNKLDAFIGNRRGGLNHLVQIDTPIVSINELTVLPFSIYPNPAEHYLYIDCNECNGSLNKITMFDLQGKLVASKSSTNGLTKINIGSLSSGIYLIEVESGLQKAYQKVVVK